MVSSSIPPPAVSSSSIARPDSGPTLLGLPREVRHQVYSVLLHMPDFLRQDWRVTPCLPYVCRQIYEETIPLLYSNTFFSFNSPIMCNIFLDGIGHNITYIRGIEIWFSPLEMEGVEKVFRRFPSTSQLHTIALFEREMRSTQDIIKKLKDAGPVQHSLAQLNGVRCIKYNAGLYSQYENRPEILLAILGICTKMADVNLSSESFFKQPGIIDSFEERYFDPNWRASSQESSRWVLGCTRGFKDHEKTGKFSLQFRNGRAVILS